MMKLIA